MYYIKIKYYTYLLHLNILINAPALNTTKVFFVTVQLHNIYAN